jgi:hypothetical protein
MFSFSVTKTLALTGLAATATLLGVNPTQAFSVTVGGSQWDVTTLTGSYNDNAATLQSQTWWGDSVRAKNFASAVGESLGLPFLDQAGPFFVWLGDLEGRGPTGISWVKNSVPPGTYPGDSGQIPGLLYEFVIPGDSIETYAIATATTPVPEPLTILGSIAAVGFGAVCERIKRKKDATNKD